jgi:hypothetical protein
VGSWVGEAVGATEGELLGDNDGTDVGPWVGEAVGATEGELLGDNDGTAVGSWVGDAVGAIVGETLGSRVVGANEGDIVTHTSSSPHVPSKQSISDWHGTGVGESVGVSVGGQMPIK